MEAPKAFGVQNEVEPSLWMALYKGQVSPPESGTYYFVGGGDNILIVRLNGNIVFDKSWNYQEIYGIDKLGNRQRCTTMATDIPRADSTRGNRSN